MLVLQQFSEFLHLARKPVREEAITLGVPQVEVIEANPVSVRVSVHADVDRARFEAVDIAAGVIFHAT